MTVTLLGFARRLNERAYTYRRIISFWVVGGLVALIGSGLLFLFVQVFHLDENIAYFLQTVIALQLNFNLNDLVTWGDWRTENGSYWQRWGKFHLTRLSTVVLCQGFFYLMVVIGIPLMIAYVINIALGMGINYVTSDKLVFRKKRKK